MHSGNSATVIAFVTSELPTPASPARGARRPGRNQQHHQRQRHRRAGATDAPPSGKRPPRRLVPHDFRLCWASSSSAPAAATSRPCGPSDRAALGGPEIAIDRYARVHANANGNGSTSRAWSRSVDCDLRRHDHDRSTDGSILSPSAQTTK